MKESNKIMDQHLENSEWLGKLSFYNDDIKILQGRLAEIASKNNAGEVLSEVEHFQNQFIIQQKNVDDIMEMVKDNEKKLRAEIEANPVASDHRRSEYHTKEKDAVISFEKNFNDLRSEFKLFAAKWM